MVLFPLHLSHPGYLVYALPLEEWRSKVRILKSWRQWTQKKLEQFLFDLLWFLKSIVVTINNADPKVETMTISLDVSPKKTMERNRLFTKKHKASELDDYSGADPGFFLGGGAPLRNGVTDWWPDVNTSCIRKLQVISGGDEVCTLCALPLDPPLLLYHMQYTGRASQGEYIGICKHHKRYKLH